MNNKTIILLVLLALACMLTCTRDNLIPQTRRYAELIATRPVSKLGPNLRTLHWTLFDTLALVEQEEHPDSAMSVLRYFYSKKSERTRVDNPLALDQLLALNLLTMESCDSGAIYIPYGDNDFYPALYLQKVMRKRKDLLIFHNTFGRRPEFRQVYSSDSRIQSLFEWEEWLAGPPDTLNTVHWVVLRAIERAEVAPPVHFATICRHYLKISRDQYWQKGITWKVGASPDSLEWARMNCKFLANNLHCEVLEKPWEPRILEWGWCYMPFVLAGRSIDLLVRNACNEEAAKYFREFTPVFDCTCRWWWFGLGLVENNGFEKEFIIEGAQNYLSTVQDTTGFDSIIVEYLAKMK